MYVWTLKQKSHFCLTWCSHFYSITFAPTQLDRILCVSYIAQLNGCFKKYFQVSLSGKCHRCHPDSFWAVCYVLSLHETKLCNVPRFVVRGSLQFIHARACLCVCVCKYERKGKPNVANFKIRDVPLLWATLPAYVVGLKLTPWNRFLQKLIVDQLTKNFFAFYETQGFITMLRRGRRVILLWARWSISHPHRPREYGSPVLYHQSNLFPLRFLTKIFYEHGCPLGGCAM